MYILLMLIYHYLNQLTILLCYSCALFRPPILFIYLFIYWVKQRPGNSMAGNRDNDRHLDAMFSKTRAYEGGRVILKICW